MEEGMCVVKKLPGLNTPIYLAVKKILLEEIQAGKIGENGKLPSEQALARRFNVSRVTIRSALQSLEKDGAVNTRHGIGTFLISKGLQLKARIDEAHGFFHLIRESGHIPAICELNLQQVAIHNKLSVLMGVPQNQNAYLLERLFLGDGKPVIFASELIPSIFLTREPGFDEIPESVYEFAENFCYDNIEYSITEIVSIKTNSKLKNKMLLDSHETLLKFEELHYTKQNKPIIFSKVFVRDKIIRFQVLRRRQQY